jgi:AAHS family 4-hydroxybenzoate transporter-like MFS transporter
MTIKTIDVAEIIDRQKMGAFQIRVIILCALLQFLDGFDTQSIAYVAPALARAWGFDRAALGPVFGAGIAGILIGGLSIGPLADRFGRKKPMIIAVALFGIFTLLTATATSLPMLFVLRFLAGLGLGGVIPSTVVVASEYAPSRRRASMVTLMACGFALGAASGGALAGAYLLALGWHTIFYVGGVLPLLMIFFLIKWLPESLRFLTVSGTQRQRIVSILRQIEPKVSYPDDVSFKLAHQGSQRSKVIELFCEGRAWMTTLLWLVFFLNLLALNFLNNWLPTVISTSMSEHDAVHFTTFFQFGGMAGVVCMGFLADRFGFYRVLTAGFLVASALTALIGVSTTSREALPIVLGFCGFCVIGVQMTLGALSATLYPTAVRATGTSWSSGIGRIGSFAGPVAGGVLLGMHLPLQTVFMVVALPTLLGAVCVLALRGLTSKSRKEDAVAPVGQPQPRELTA